MQLSFVYSSFILHIIDMPYRWQRYSLGIYSAGIPPPPWFVSFKKESPGPFTAESPKGLGLYEKPLTLFHAQS